ncbi:MAG: ABC transporter ATP-binding protein/permease [Cyanothece sp. SIO2G6]|nr:ABC transporter ATP-binding protein/permease [Cyanothece sp. SIO2G6]
MSRFSFQGCRRFWSIAKVYWVSDEKWKAFGFLLCISLLLSAYTGIGVLLNNQSGSLISALVATDQQRFVRTVLIFLGGLVVHAPMLAGYLYLRDRLGLEWRRWLTNHFLNRYFSDRSFYHISQVSPDIDNPDQRIAEDIRRFTQESLTLVVVLAESTFAVIAFSSVLWSISPALVILLVVYAVLGTGVMIGVFGQPLVRLNFEQLKREANFRFSLIRIRENAEAIAFYQGEQEEAAQANNQFMQAFENNMRLLFWELNMNTLTKVYEFIPYVLPALVVAPLVFGGHMEVGKLTEAQGAFIRVFFSLNVIVDRFHDLTAFGAGIDRLYDFAVSIGCVDPKSSSPSDPSSESLASLPEVSDADSPKTAPVALALEVQPTSHIDVDLDVGLDRAVSPHSVIQHETAPNLALNHVTVQTPNYQRTLIEDLSLELDAHASMLVMGPSGCGKSSLLRAIAGLWNAGEGLIQSPDSGQILFLPQKPYMIIGSLRQQLLYPHTNTDFTDEQLQDVLYRVNLPTLAEDVSDFDTEKDWSHILSLGEQQRLSFARVLLHRPKYAILDEATSALNRANEDHLYSQLKETGTTYLSVGHRESLALYHRFILCLSDKRTWHFGSCPI